ncbi:MAG TPA: histidine kinase dimerization/phospho-acceptor domain-containing protein [Terriglobales bacterium]|nr:histidine kinase dimerization/phospho-acceptor domain-containing protein [Terriglobales bacterium]
MSATGARTAAEYRGSPESRGRSPLAHLLHALNQPLTGLQCSLELAVSGPRRPDQYVQTLREGLDLTSRMRGLVEAIRELADLQQRQPERAELILLDQLLRETAADLHPVAEAKQVRLQLEDRIAHPVRGDRQQLTALTFRLLESGLSLAGPGGTVQISGRNERRRAHIDIRWEPGPLPIHSPFSPAELGLLIARAGWERAGAEWVESRAESMQGCGFRLPLAEPDSGFGDVK